jgi:hypothetical protein
VIWGGKASLARRSVLEGGETEEPRCPAPNGSDSVQALAFDLPGSRRSALTCGGGITIYLSADF